MSGGSWNYKEHNIYAIIEDICDDERMKKKVPKLTKLIYRLGLELSTTLHDLDYDFAGDTEIEDFNKFENEAMDKLLKCFKFKK